MRIIWREYLERWAFGEVLEARALSTVTSKSKMMSEAEALLMLPHTAELLSYNEKRYTRHVLDVTSFICC